MRERATGCNAIRFMQLAPEAKITEKNNITTG
jgi:hypothetical protein